MQKPWLGDARSNVYAYGLDNELAKEVSLCLGVPIFGREACFENDVNCSTTNIPATLIKKTTNGSGMM